MSSLLLFRSHKKEPNNISLMNNYESNLFPPPEIHETDLNFQSSSCLLSFPYIDVIIITILNYNKVPGGWKCLEKLCLVSDQQRAELDKFMSAEA